MWHGQFFVHVLVIVPCLALLPDDDSSCQEGCFHQPPEACPSPESTCRCRQLPNCRRAAVCCNVNKFQLTEGVACGNISADGQVEALHIRNATLDVLNVTHPVWKRLRFLTITDGNITSVVGEFAKLTIVSCLNLSSNHIQKFENRSLVNLYNLSFLDLSHNNLSDIPRFKKGNVTLDISANDNMTCTSLSDALKRNEINFNNENKTFCAFSPHDTFWFSTETHVPLNEIIAIHKLQQNCFENCTCETDRLRLVPGKFPTYVFKVNCSGNRYTSLPLPLPKNTISLDISNNNITSLKELSDPSYETLTNLHADNNRIDSILPLEGTMFMGHFQVLSLKNNSLKTLETYVLSTIKFDRNSERHFFIGLNNLHCDCHTARDIKGWLLAKQTHIPDYNEIRCDNMDVRVIDLDIQKLCQSPEQDWKDYIYYVITVEVLLLVFLVAKVSYDYWIFKTTGYLPWPASKMPKLPCDWLCE